MLGCLLLDWLGCRFGRSVAFQGACTSESVVDRLEPPFWGGDASNLLVFIREQKSAEPCQSPSLHGDNRTVSNRMVHNCGYYWTWVLRFAGLFHCRRASGTILRSAANSVVRLSLCQSPFCTVDALLLPCWRNTRFRTAPILVVACGHDPLVTIHPQHYQRRARRYP